MEVFSCCSLYVDCSDALKCLHIEDEYTGCRYRKNLEAGRIFYGINAGKTVRISPETAAAEGKKLRKNWNEPPKLYLDCFKELFPVYARDKFFSRELTEEQQRELVEAFNSKGIPYKTETSLVEFPVDGETPYNSRVIFTVGGTEYHVLRTPAYLMKKSSAYQISEALEEKGFCSKVETFETSSPISNHSNQQPTVRAEAKPIKQPEVKLYTQLNLFDIYFEDEGAAKCI